MTWRESAKAAVEHGGVQAVVAFLLLLPLAATAGQYWASGFWRQSVGVDILFWPGAQWRWGVWMNAAAAMAPIGALYVTGIAALARRRMLARTVAAGLGAMIAAQLLGHAVNRITGWRELQNMASFDFAGKVNRVIFAEWHNPVWEEAVFRGLPLACYGWLARRKLGGTAALWAYLLVPAMAFAAYHVPGHGYARIADTLLVGVVFAWMALRWSFWSVLVLHCVMDAAIVLSLAKMGGVPGEEIRWLADHAGLWNGMWSGGVLAAAGLMLALMIRDRAVKKPAFR